MRQPILLSFVAAALVTAPVRAQSDDPSASPPPLLDETPKDPPRDPPPPEKTPPPDTRPPPPQPKPPKVLAPTVTPDEGLLPRPLLGGAAGAGGAALGAIGGGVVMFLATFAPIDAQAAGYLALLLTPAVPTLAALGAGSAVLLIAFNGASGAEWGDMVGCSLSGCACLGAMVGLPISTGCNVSLCAPRSWMEGPGRLLVMAPSAGAGLGAAAGLVAGGVGALNSGVTDTRLVVVSAGLGAAAGGLLGGAIGGVAAGFKE